jgi:hypothetical protein
MRSSVYIMGGVRRKPMDIPEDELAENKAGLEASFGIWKRKGVDGVAYQEKLRDEWERCEEAFGQNRLVKVPCKV